MDNFREIEILFEDSPGIGSVNFRLPVLKSHTFKTLLVEELIKKVSFKYFKDFIGPSLVIFNTSSPDVSFQIFMVESSEPLATLNKFKYRNFFYYFRKF